MHPHVSVMHPWGRLHAALVHLHPLSYALMRVWSVLGVSHVLFDASQVLGPAMGAMAHEIDQNDDGALTLGEVASFVNQASH